MAGALGVVGQESVDRALAFYGQTGGVPSECLRQFCVAGGRAGVDGGVADRRW